MKKSAFARLATWRVLAIVVGVAAYVLGAKAGCEPYEQIRTQAAAIPVVGFDGEPLLVNLGDGSGEDGVGDDCSQGDVANHRTSLSGVALAKDRLADLGHRESPSLIEFYLAGNGDLFRVGEHVEQHGTWVGQGRTYFWVN